MTLDEAREAMTFCGSYERLPALEKMFYLDGLTEGDARTLLGEIWTVCDNLWQFDELLSELIPAGPAPEMMDDAERAALAALPARVRVYRGADRGVNEFGYSWSLDRSTADRFPFYMRYRAKDPVLVTAILSRRRIAALMLSREEREIVVQPIWPRVLSVKAISRAADWVHAGGV